MVDEEEEQIIKKMISKFDKPFFPPSISTKSHLIFLKYTSPKYRTYIINQYKSLCNKLHNNVNKYEIFYLSLLFNDLILYNCENEPIITNISLLVFCCFYLSVKFRLNQYEVMSIKSLKKFNPEKFNDYSNEEIQYVETLCLKLLNYKLNYMTSYDFLLLLIYNYNPKKKVIDYSMDILNKIISGDIKEYIFKSPLKIAYEAISFAKEKIKENNYAETIDINNSSHHKIKNNNSNVNINSNNNLSNRTSSIYQKISKLINATNENNKYKNNNKKNNNYLINTISTNSSSVNKNIGYGDSIPQLNDTNSEINQKKQIGKDNPDNPEVNKPIYIEPLYSISSTKIINQLNSNNKKRNNSVINGLKYEIKACQTVNSNNEQNEDLDKDKDKIRKKEIKKISKNKNEAATSRYLINVNLAKKKHIKMQSLNDFSGIKLSLSNTKKNQCCSFMRDNIKNMKALLQFSNHHISNK